jgi:hypothetical protein
MGLQTFVEDVRRWGFARATFVRVMRRIERLLRFRTFVIHARALDPTILPDRIPDGASIRVLTEAELLHFASDPSLDMTHASIKASCARGDVCFGYVEGQTLVSYSWYSTAPTRAEPGLWVRFAEGYSYSYKSFTLPSHRGRHLQHILLRAAEASRTAQGLRYNVDYIHVLNLPSITADRRYGNRPIGYAVIARWFGNIYPFHSPGAKRHGFAFVTRSNGTD